LKKKSDSPPYYKIISPKMVLEALDREYPLERFGKFFTMVYLILNIRTGKLIYSSAGHPPTVLLHPQRPLDLLSQGGTIIGLGGVIPFKEEEKVLSKGDKLIFYTDGVVDFQNQHGESYGEERFLALLRSLEDQPLELILDGVCESLTAFGHQARVQDDVTLLGMEFKDIS
jgi:sigma-B regulation protein RsbU (phosphoserine phosphatase)